MSEPTFDLPGAGDPLRRRETRGHRLDCHDGELRPLSQHDVEMRIERSAAGDYAIHKLVARSGLAFRRGWPHIRADKTDLTIFWFLRHGRMTVAASGGRFAVQAGECAVTRSAEPFYMEMAPEEGGCFEAMHVVVPSHKLHAILSEGVEAGRPFPTLHGDLHVAERVFGLLFDEDGAVDREVAEELVEALLKGLGRGIARLSGQPAPRASVADRRVAEVTRYIGRHFANPDLNARMVAESCGISVRYLCHVLKKNALSFSDLVWDMRMATAHGWLRDARMRHHSIGEIAYLAGFKSSAHFSRMFRLRHGVAPREFRVGQLNGAEPPAAAAQAIAA